MNAPPIKGPITDPNPQTKALQESSVDIKDVSESTHRYPIYSVVSLGLVLTDINVRAPRYIPVPCRNLISDGQKVQFCKILHTPTPPITRPKIRAVIFGAAPQTMEPTTKSNENFHYQYSEVENRIANDKPLCIRSWRRRTQRVFRSPTPWLFQPSRN